METSISNALWMLRVSRHGGSVGHMQLHRVLPTGYHHIFVSLFHNHNNNNLLRHFTMSHCSTAGALGSVIEVCLTDVSTGVVMGLHTLMVCNLSCRNPKNNFTTTCILTTPHRKDVRTTNYPRRLSRRTSNPMKSQRGYHAACDIPPQLVFPTDSPA